MDDKNIQAVPQGRYPQPRPRSNSAIPRPTSGTSRRATLQIKSPSSTNVSTNSRPRSFVLNKGNPPSSFKMPERQVPPSETMLPYAQRPHRDSSGLQRQFRVRHHSTQSLSSPHRTVSHIQPAAVTPKQAVIKSITLSSLATMGREVTPRRQLMRPLEPPLPRSQTLSNVTCFNRVSIPLSRRNSTDTASIASDRSIIDVVDALNESRMTEHEIHGLHQVGKKGLTYRPGLLRTNIAANLPAGKPKQPISPISTSFARKPDAIATLNLSVNDFANMNRIEENRRRSSGGRPFFINTTLSNISTGVDLLTPEPILSESSSSPDGEWECNTRHASPIVLQSLSHVQTDK
jgi:hypothetical protein